MGKPAPPLIGVTAPLGGDLPVGGVLVLESVCFSYRDQDAPAVNDVSLSLAAGETAAVMGPSGCGKSTLLYLAAGLLRPDRGVISVGGAEITSLGLEGRAEVRRTSLGIVFQFGELVAELSLRDNVALAAELSGLRRHQALARSGELLERVGLSDLCDRYPAQVSGGEGQRCAVA
ncbi:MAG: ATP-binding cassette domain-containing protein, partial [Bifidobacteriaceae bacterium]|nr:ATP-binding cassette domain-containing protein [Bifidobacteriaceae bacterium]